MRLDGGFAQYAIATAAYTARLPQDVDFAQIAPILCAGVTTYKWIAISGLGGLGHVAVQYAKAMGLNVVGLCMRTRSRRSWKRRTAARMGSW